MPLYEYKCDSCGAVFELIQKFSDEPLKTHKTCGGRVERVITAAALQFKGSGWYVNDYGRKSGSSGAKNGGDKDTASKASDKSEKSEKKESSSVTPPATDKK
jgi:putative FmdB family regulatory protein